MNAKLTKQILTLTLLNCCISLAAFAQITFVKTPASNARQKQDQGLTPDKKKSLSNYGPEDAFPGAREQEERQSRSKRSAPRQSSSPATPQPSTPPPAPELTPVATPIAASPTPAIGDQSAMAKTVGVQTAPDKSWGATLVPITLSTAALLVFGALIYVVRMLRKKLKEGEN